MTKTLIDPSKIFPLCSEVKMGNKLEITCRGTNVSWIFPWDIIQPRGVHFQDNKVYIDNANLEHQGYFICRGIDEKQKKFFSISKVSVLSKCRFEILHKCSLFINCNHTCNNRIIVK